MEYGSGDCRKDICLERIFWKYLSLVSGHLTSFLQITPIGGLIYHRNIKTVVNCINCRTSMHLTNTELQEHEQKVVSISYGYGLIIFC